MRKPIEYIIADGRTRDELEENVNARLKEGYEPSGGPIVAAAILAGRRQWMQAMVRFEDTN